MIMKAATLSAVVGGVIGFITVGIATFFIGDSVVVRLLGDLGP